MTIGHNLFQSIHGPRLTHERTEPTLKTLVSRWTRILRTLATQPPAISHFDYGSTRTHRYHLQPNIMHSHTKPIRDPQIRDKSLTQTKYTTAQESSNSDASTKAYFERIQLPPKLTSWNVSATHNSSITIINGPSSWSSRASYRTFNLPMRRSARSLDRRPRYLRRPIQTRRFTYRSVIRNGPLPPKQ